MAFLSLADTFFKVKQGCQGNENQCGPSSYRPCCPQQQAAGYGHQYFLVFFHFQIFGKNNDLLTIFAVELLHFEKDSPHTFQFHRRHRAYHAGNPLY